MSSNLLLDFCTLQQWKPRYLDESGENLHNAEQVTREAKEMLEAGSPKLCLGLIKVAQTLGLRSVGQLELKATALRVLKGSDSEDISQSSETGQTNADLVRKLLEECTEYQWIPQFLSKTSASEPTPELETKVLQEAEATRNNNSLDLSLKLVDLAIQHDCRSLWLLHSKALTLSQQGQFDFAHELWEQLLQNKDIPDFIAVISEAYTRSKENKLANDSPKLTRKLIATIQNNQKKPEFIYATDEPIGKAEIQELILKEAEFQRNNKQAKLSCDLITIALDHGYDSHWLWHNKALALQKMGKLEDAILIWESLLSKKIEGVSVNAKSALLKARGDLAIERANQAHASGSLEIAIETLAPALVEDPEQQDVETLLKTMLNKRRAGDTKNNIQNTFQEEHQDDLDLNHAFLMHVKYGI